ILVKECHHLLQAVKDPLGMLESIAFDAQYLLFAVAESHCVDLGKLEAIEVLLPRGLRQSMTKLGKGASPLLPLANESAHPFTLRHAVGETVEQLELAGRLHQSLVLVLAMKLDQQIAQPFEQTHRGC